MHKPSEAPRYFFNSFASAFSGKLTRPFCEVIDTQASCALPPTGGYSSARSGPYHFKEVISIGAAYSQVSGSEHLEEKAWNQVVTATLEDVNILGQFTAKKIVAIMNIKREFESELPTFRIVGSRVEGLYVGGEHVEVHFNHGIETWEAASRHHCGNQRAKGDVILGSAVQGLKSRLSVEGNVIDVPDFGRVILGEYMITPYARSLSIFRIELGCEFEGGAGGGNVGGNGTRTPPWP